MTRPIGSKNLEIPEPPFTFVFAEVKVVLTPHQVAANKKKGIEEPYWEFDISLEVDGQEPNPMGSTMSLDDLEDLATYARQSVKWTQKMDKEKDKLESQLKELQEKLKFLQR